MDYVEHHLLTKAYDHEAMENLYLYFGNKGTQKNQMIWGIFTAKITWERGWGWERGQVGRDEILRKMR